MKQSLSNELNSYLPEYQIDLEEYNEKIKKQIVIDGVKETEVLVFRRES